MRSTGRPGNRASSTSSSHSTYPSIGPRARPGARPRLESGLRRVSGALVELKHAYVHLDAAVHLGEPARMRTQRRGMVRGEVAVGDLGQDFGGQPLGPEELFLLLAGWAEAAAATGECNQDAPAARAAP
jgi:hypothetical protein